MIFLLSDVFDVNGRVLPGRMLAAGTYDGAGTINWVVPDNASWPSAVPLSGASILHRAVIARVQRSHKSSQPAPQTAKTAWELLWQGFFGDRVSEGDADARITTVSGPVEVIWEKMS